MENFENNFNIQSSGTQSLSKTFVSTVFLWMFAALGITALTAYLFGTSESLFMTLINTETGSLSFLGWIVMFAPFAIVLIMSMGNDRLSVTSMVLMYVLYSILMGMSLSFIFMAYSSASIFKTFIITSVMFGLMALVGYTTKTDLTRFGSILMMALVGIIVASIVNFFMHSTQLEYIVSILGVLIFTGLTAWDVQKIKRIGESGIFQGEATAKLTIFAALSLYLDFLNLFLYLLRFFGNSKN